MVKVKDIAAAVECAAPLRLAESYDNPGLIAGDPDAEIGSALLSLDITEDVLDEARQLGAKMIVSHHPVVFHPLRRLTGSTYVERVVAGAIRDGIALYASHTNLDSAPGGLSWHVGRLLGLRNMELLDAPRPDEPGAGFGVVGDLQHPVETKRFLKELKEKLELKVLRHSPVTAAVTERVALCTGAGASLVSAARAKGAQIYVSADFRYNDFLDAGRGLVIADAGHWETERYAADILHDIIRKKLPTFALHKSLKSVNPVNYLI